MVTGYVLTDVSQTAFLKCIKMTLTDEVLRLDVHAAAGIITPEPAYVEMAMALDRRTEEKCIALTPAESVLRWSSRIQAVLEDDLGARGDNLREKIESSKRKLPAELLNQLRAVALPQGAGDSAEAASGCAETLRQLLRRRPRRRLSPWPRLAKTRGIVREICSYQLGPKGQYAALIDIDGRIVTLISDAPAGIEVGDTVTVGWARTERPRARLRLES